MNDAMDVNTKWVQLNWEQIDAIVEDELRSLIISTHEELNGTFIHPDDFEMCSTLLPAAKIIYKYYAGENKLKKLKEELYEKGQAVRGSEQFAYSGA